MPAWLIPAASILAAVIVGTLNFLAQRWRYRVDRTAAHVEIICSEINNAADLATRYWLINPASDKDRAELSSLEAQIIGRDQRIQALFLAFRYQDKRLNLLNIMRNNALDFKDSLSGGNFKGHDRPSDPTRAQLVQIRAAELNGAIRSAFVQRTKHWF